MLSPVTWKKKKKVSRRSQTETLLPAPISAVREPTGWATSKTFHTQCTLGEIPFQRAERQRSMNETATAEAD